MSGNTFGKVFQLTTFGESHGAAIGGVIDGCPSGIELDLQAIQKDLNRRKPGQSAIVTQRKEPDEVQFFSGIFEGKTNSQQKRTDSSRRGQCWRGQFKPATRVYR